MPTVKYISAGGLFLKKKKILTDLTEKKGKEKKMSRVNLPAGTECS